MKQNEPLSLHIQQRPFFIDGLDRVIKSNRSINPLDNRDRLTPLRRFVMVLINITHIN